jgi:transposase-like protein
MVEILRFTLSLRDVEDLLAERGEAVSYETVRRWVNHFGPMIAAELRKRRLKPHLASRRGLSENRRPHGLSLAGS